MGNKIKHLEMIQSLTTRMAQNSFMIKGWTLTLVVAMFAFAPQTEWFFLPIVLLPILIFACLDAYYLQLEKRYRNLYDIVRNKEDTEIDFQLKISKDCKTKKDGYGRCLFSTSILLYYLPILIVAIGIIVVLFAGVGK